MLFQRAIDIRCSRRKYLNTPIDYGFANKLKALVKELGATGGVNMQLELNNGEAFKGLRSYGAFSGVSNYIGLIEDKTDKFSKEKLGYYGEFLVLHATDLRLGTCWAAGTFDRSLCPFKTQDNERIAALIAIGNTPGEKTVKEKLIHSVTHRRRKAPDEIFESDTTPPKWFMRGIYAAHKAPSSINRMPVMFVYRKGEVIARVPDTDETFLIDLGIAKLHFELGVGSGKWDWGNGAQYHFSQPLA
jgi:hypothetical protein